jgi:hypothetical protein
MKVYFILDSASNAVKIGKANNIDSRISDLQTGNPNPLELIHYIDCESEEQSFLLERKLHNKYKELRLVGEWFMYDESVFQELFQGGLKLQRKCKREPIIIETLFGQESFGIEDFPCCFFYPNLTAQIMNNYEESIRKKNPFRTMKYPTEGKQMLLPWSTKTDRVFISDKKHKENLKMKKFQENLEMKNFEISTAGTLEIFLNP